MQLFGEVKLRRIGIPAVVLGICLLCVIVLRGPILRKAITLINAKLKSHHYSAHWDGARFKGLRTIFIRNIFIQSNDGKKETSIDSIYVKVRVIPLLVKKIRIRKIQCSEINVMFTAEADSSLALKKDVSETDSASVNFISKGQFADFAYRNIRRFFNDIPAKIFFDKIKIRIRFADNTSLIALNNVELKKGAMTGEMIVMGNNKISRIPFMGKLDKTVSVINFIFVNPDTSLLPIPFLKEKFDIEVGFDSLSFLADLSKRNRQKVNAVGNLTFTGLKLKGKRFSTDEIRINRLQSGFKINIGEDFVEIDSSTVAMINDIRFHPYVKFALKDGQQIDMRVLPVIWESADFFQSLPQGMFTSLSGIQTKGRLHWYFDFSVNLKQPDSLIFDTQLRGEEFNVIRYGTDDYRMMNGSFFHTVYDKGRKVASFTVGPENPDFVFLNDISPYLRAAVMTSEDGSFYYHNGFNPDAFRESVVTNIKEKRFARGGSTISMQLIKNVFLTRNKTLARKIEEALIVWLVENKNLVSKQRMYEVYLNIIEWGPGIYGINQASHFYFDKPPARLTFPESIFLASIVPHPKWYKYSFVKNGELKPFYNAYFNRMKDLMVRKQFIMDVDTFGQIPDVLITGPASGVFENPETAPADSEAFKDFNNLPLFKTF